jgi:predicted esterase
MVTGLAAARLRWTLCFMMHASTFQLRSQLLDESRAIHVMCGDRFRAGLPRFAVFCIDGQLLTDLVSAVPERISTSCMFVGIESNPETRDYDLIRGYFPDRYDSHLRFVVEEVMGHIDHKYEIGDDKCVTGICGFSNGATFAHSLASQDSVFRFAIVFSAADNRVRRDEYPTPHNVRYYLAAGTREPDYLAATKAIAGDLTEAGAENFLVEREANHSMDFWADEFPRAMTWIVEA